MTLANSLSVDDLITELGTGRATVKFILDRFSSLLPPQDSKGDQRYSSSVIPLIIRIKDLMSSGILPSQIEEIMTKNQQTAQENTQVPKTDIHMNPEALSFIRDMVSDIRGHQGRIAKAHEQRAQAEQRKAVAIEKRAEAEEKKAAAMNNIAQALQEMNQFRAVDVRDMEIAGKAAQALTLGDSPEKKSQDPFENEFEDPLAGMEELLNDPETKPDPVEPEPPDRLTPSLDDLTTLVEEPSLSKEDLDDLSELIDTVSEPKDETVDMDGLFEEDLPLPEPDDLSRLVDGASDPIAQSQDIDDLYSLVEENDSETDLDDLSLLVVEESSTAPGDMDDLSALIDSPAQDAIEEPFSPDLTLDSGEKNKQGDDLWALVDKSQEIPTDDLDDLGALVDPVLPPASLKPDITPDQDMAKYKAAVMKIIIELKSEGLSARETTDRLNKDGVATLSGKPQWGENAIVKIYGFIDSAN